MHFNTTTIFSYITSASQNIKYTRRYNFPEVLVTEARVAPRLVAILFPFSVLVSSPQEIWHYGWRGRR